MKYLIAVSGMVAFAIDDQTYEKILEYAKNNGWKRPCDVPHFKRKLYHGHYEVLIKLLPTHWLDFEYEQNGADFHFWGRWIKNEEAEKLLKEQGWERAYWTFNGFENSYGIGICTGNPRKLSPPQ
jgi:hypothetical protein